MYKSIDVEDNKSRIFRSIGDMSALFARPNKENYSDE